MNKESDSYPIIEVTGKDFEKRKLISSLASIPMLMIVLTAIILPIGLITLLMTGDMPGIIISLTVTIIAEMLVIMWALWVSGQLNKIKETLYLKTLKLKHLGLGAGTGVILFLGLQALSIIVNKLGLKTVESSETSSSLASIQGPAQIIILFLVVPFIVPAVEEIFFRGYVYGFIRKSKTIPKKYSFITALIISSLFFSIMHFQGFANFNDFFVLIWIFIVAVVNALLLEKTQSLYTAIASHITYNFITSLVSYIATL